MSRAALEELLQATREIEKALGANDPGRLSALLACRGEIFARLDVEAVPPEEESLLKEIRASEERCLTQAAKQKNELRNALSAVRTRRRLEKAYGRHR